jgi:hypothetical protein
MHDDKCGQRIKIAVLGRMVGPTRRHWREGGFRFHAMPSLDGRGPASDVR